MNGDRVRALNAGVVRREAELADGRQLFYYDDRGTDLNADRRIDTRVMGPRPEAATMRQDVLTGDWISVADARQNRAFLPPPELDPLAPQSSSNPSEIPSRYDVAVFENRSPAFGPALLTAHGMMPAAVDPPRGLDDMALLGIERTRTAVGRCEVVCFSPDYQGSFGTQTLSRARTVVEAWVDRTAELSALAGIQQVFPFENRGETIGVTLPHPHGQIYAYPYVTPRTSRLLASIAQTSPDLLQRVLDAEMAGSRVIISGEYWTAYVPFAARWPIEIHMMPHRHLPDFTGTSDQERDELARILLRLLRGLDLLHSTPTPYIAAWHQAPVNVGRDAVRLRLEITSPRRAFDRLKYLAGSEAAMGAWIADVAPEDAAARIREVVAQTAL